MAAQSTSALPLNEPTKANAPPQNADLKTTWAFLEQGVDHIMTRLHTGMSYTYYILLYSTTYNYCTSVPKPSSSYPLSGQRNGANLLGADLYKSLTEYFHRHLKNLKKQAEDLSDLPLLQYYAREWERYTQGANYVNRLFTYLNRHWVRREKDEGRKGIYTIYTLSLVQWKNEFFMKLRLPNGTNHLTNAVLKQIELARNGEAIDTTLLKKVIESYVFLGLDEADAQRQQLDVYREAFQTPFIAATQAYYTAESEAFVTNNSVADYLKKAEERLQEEDDRVTLLLHHTTRKELKDKCEHVLIRLHEEIMWEEFQLLLEADRSEDLARMYRLLARIPEGLEPLRKKFEEHVKKSGLEAVEKITPAAGAVNETGKAETLDPKAYVEALLSVYRKYESVVQNSFRGEAGFVASLDKACSEYCNRNAAATTATKCPELLASYVDSLLKKNQKDLDPEGLEAALVESMIVFKYIVDRDVYQKFYQKNLARRLVGQISASEDSEASMISKLKAECGFDYTSKLTRMFQDVSISRDLTDSFREKLRNNNDVLDVDVNVMVLATNVWPLQAPPTDYSVPREIQAAYDKFLAFYNTAHSGRRLQWLWHVCKNELRTTYLSQKYIFMTSAYQMAILVQYNGNDSLTFADLQTATKISEAVLKPQLGLLVKAKILLQTDDTYDLNTNFKSKKIRVNLNQVIKSEAKAEATEVLQAVDEDRKFVYQATIVRLMKARKTMKHQALIQEVTAIISTKFTPKVSDMKKAIDHLLDKEYLERVADTKDAYNYLA